MIVGLILRILSIIGIGFQAALLDWYLVNGGKSDAWLGWIAADILVIASFIASYLYADHYFQQNAFEKLRQREQQNRDAEQLEKEKLRAIRKSNRELRRAVTVVEEPKTPPPDEQVELTVRTVDVNTKSDKPKLKRRLSLAVADEFGHRDAVQENHRVASLKVGETLKKYKLGALPLTYISWTLYAVVLISKMLVIFLTFGEHLDVHALFGSNMLELAFALTAAIFALVASSHKKIPPKTHQKPVIRWMQSHVMLEILDSVEMLGCLYETSGEKAGGHHKIETGIQNSVLAFVALQMLLPSVGLYQLSSTNFAHQSPPAYFSMLQLFLSTLFGNIPFLVMRVYLSARKQFTESAFIFIIKNVYGIVSSLTELVHWIALIRLYRREGRTTIPDAFEEESSGSDSD